MMIGLAVEIAINLVQQIIFVGFLYLFFDKIENKKINIVGFLATVCILFFMENYFTFNEMTLNHLDSLIIIVVLLLYSLIFLRGELYLRIIIPIIEFGLNILLSFSLLFIVPLIGGKPIENVITYSTTLRYIFLVITNLTYIFLLVLIIRIRKKKLLLNNIYDILAFIVIPLLCMFGMYTDIFIYQKVNFNDSILSLIFINLFILIVVSVMVWLLLIKTSKNNRIRTDLLLSKQREELYKKSVLSTNEQLQKLSEIKHDVRNNYLSIEMLISNGDYDRAKELCGNASEKFSIIYSSINTNNPVLNAIFNVELEKANSLDIDFNYNINDSLLFVQDTDIVSLVGNLCDNAIEYLSEVPKAKRKMQFDIIVHRDNYCIVCKNSIVSSVLNCNPELNTTKSDLSVHGKGIDILRRISKKYNGDMFYKEKDGFFVINIVLKNK